MKYIFLIFIPILLFSNDSIIILNKNADDVKLFAAKELKKHLDMILNEDTKIIYSYNKQTNISKHIFYIGMNPDAKKLKLKPEESVYKIKDQTIYIYGDDKIIDLGNSPINTVTNMRNKTGTLFAVYDFLYNELNVRWTEPGDIGIFYKEFDELNFSNKQFNWYPKISFRYFRNDIWRWNKITGNEVDMYKYTPKQLQPTKKYVERKETEELLWMRRMKQGIHNKPNYGHAFTRYWDKYGKKNTEWFALGKNGIRGLEGSKSKKSKRVKLCVTNENLQKEISKNWEKDFIKHQNHNIYNACINDSRSYCRCYKCRALDSDYKKQPSSEFETESKTDRYVYFWNKLLNKAKQFNPDAQIIAYAYSDYRYPPKKQNLSDDIILGFVPKFSDLPIQTLIDINKWKEKGLTQVFLRPNDFNDDIGMPMGHEKFIYDKFKVFKNLNIIGIDYDRNYNTNNWGFDGISYYILAQGLINPSKSFEELEDEYLNTFCKSKNEIKQFYHYWRDLFELKRLPHIKKSGGFSGRRYLFSNIEEFYTEKDFTITNKLLEEALLKEDTPKIKDKISRLIVYNNHSKLLFKALTSKQIFSSDYKTLNNYRIKHKDILTLSWPMVFYVEDHTSNLNRIKKLPSKVINYINSKL